MPMLFADRVIRLAYNNSTHSS